MSVYLSMKLICTFATLSWSCFIRHLFGHEVGLHCLEHVGMLLQHMIQLLIFKRKCCHNATETWRELFRQILKTTLSFQFSSLKTRDWRHSKCVEQQSIEGIVVEERTVWILGIKNGSILKDYSSKKDEQIEQMAEPWIFCLSSELLFSRFKCCLFNLNPWENVFNEFSGDI